MNIENLISGRYKISKVLGGGGCSNTFVGQLISDPTKVYLI